jgi:hypothetical protein
MINIWWGLLRFLRVVFIPPKFTELEEYLTRQVSHLEAELNRERDRYEELLNRTIFVTPSPPLDLIPQGPHTLDAQVSKEQAERKRLENASKQRWLEHVARQESKAAELMKLDEARAKDARNETASG